MSVRVGIISTAHVHAPSFAQAFMDSPLSEVVGVWDDNAVRGTEFAGKRGLEFNSDIYSLLGKVDAVVIASENMKHADHIEKAALAKRHILCEKPIAPTPEFAKQIDEAVTSTGVTFMTAFPCPFSPTFQKMKSGIEKGEIGNVLALTTTNRGTCPFSWFVEKDQSGGGAMIDHVVHVTDLLRRLLHQDPNSVFAQISSNMYSQNWDDVAKLTIGFPNGVFATIDSSWSRPKGYKTWGDVNLRATGDKGVIEAELFGQGVDTFSSGHSVSGTGSNLDALMVAEFLRAVTTQSAPLCTLHDGLMASRVAMAGYQSVKTGKAVSI